ncbi:uncharacterized protein F5Z01DRAFT_98501 [Emericellopsis atlantica]|uniref:Uncharacterized protein n=1 Tax=Emericellopsis atlantica TaxID=2614577 RepID=A0A9P7ZNN3_9HYPO|nr:uncharacterized protein F5Z01DRAFT_98501 [Emericellopsis atlantica]KAG9254838.1 hypothetical protein F5Z01DRAFT_98501 [Emericellopsis atlantica]
MPASVQTRLQFITTTAENNSPSLRPRQKRQVRSHAARSRAGRPQVHQRPLSSWLHQQCDGPASGAIGDHEALPPLLEPEPAHLPVDYSLLQLPSHVEPRVLHDALPFFRMAQERIYPKDVCYILVELDATWLAHMISDPVYFNAVAFATQGYFEVVSHGHLTAKPLLYLTRTLQLLRQRLDSPDNPGVNANSTMMTIVLLALVSEEIEPGENIANHLAGLEKLVGLRGGLSRVRSQGEELWTKVCRMDIVVAIRFDTKPRFFRDTMSWSSYLLKNQLKERRPDANAEELAQYISAKNTDLGNVWLDCKIFCDLANLAHQSGNLMRSEDFAEIMLSILYRLLHHSRMADVVQETLRLGMLAYITSIYLGETSIGIDQRRHLMHLFTSSLTKLEVNVETIPAPLGFWLLFIWHTLTSPPDAAAHLDAWLARLAEQLDVDDWEEARTLLKASLWINVLHDHMGKRVFDTLRSRIGRSRASTSSAHDIA